MGRRQLLPPVAGFGANQGKAKMDSVDQRQQTDIERLIAHCQELEDRVEEMEASILQADERSRDRAVALRTLLRVSLVAAGAECVASLHCRPNQPASTA